RSASDIENQRRPVARLKQLVAAENCKPRLFSRLDDIEHDAGFYPDPLGKVAAVLGTATSFGRDRPRQGYVAATQLLGADRQRPDSAVHCIGRKLSGPRQSLAKANDARKRVDHGEPAIARASDQQPTIVGAKVDG